MNCLETYRRNLIRKVNRDLRAAMQAPDEKAVHDFRVGVKRLTALYRFLQQIDPSLKAKGILQPYRALFKSTGLIRDGHIAIHLVRGLGQIGSPGIERLSGTISRNLLRHYRYFQKSFPAGRGQSIRTPSIRSSGIAEAAILRGKPLVLDELLRDIVATDDRMNATGWHKKRILLKRYHHTMDAFAFCPGHKSDEIEIKQIKVLEQLLGDWHDRVVTIEMLNSFTGVAAEAEAASRIMQQQDRLLLGAAKIYLDEFARWHQQ